MGRLALVVPALALALVTVGIPSSVGEHAGPTSSPIGDGPDLAQPMDHRLPDSAPEEVCAPHPFIEIDGDNSFIEVYEYGIFHGGFHFAPTNKTPTPLYRPGSGVTAGNGTAEDPYVIEDWCIVPNDTYGIFLKDTEAHVVIRDNVILGAGGLPRDGIRLRDADNVTLRANTIVGSGNGITVFDGSTRVTIAENRVHHNGLRGIAVLSEASQPVIANNSVVGNGDVGILYGVPDGQIENNTFAGNGEEGMVILSPTEGTFVERNLIRENGAHGIRLFKASDIGVTRNNVEDNAEDALHVQEGTGAVDVTDNWWGDASGPSGEIEDECTGTPADGDGGAIVVEDGSGVCFDPWLESPQGGAGAGS